MKCDTMMRGCSCRPTRRRLSTPSRRSCSAAGHAPARLTECPKNNIDTRAHPILPITGTLILLRFTEHFKIADIYLSYTYFHFPQGLYLIIKFILRNPKRSLGNPLCFAGQGLKAPDIKNWREKIENFKRIGER